MKLTRKQLSLIIHETLLSEHKLNEIGMKSVKDFALSQARGVLEPDRWLGGSVGKLRKAASGVSGPNWTGPKVTSMSQAQQLKYGSKSKKKEPEAKKVVKIEDLNLDLPTWDDIQKHAKKLENIVKQKEKIKSFAGTAKKKLKAMAAAKAKVAAAKPKAVSAWKKYEQGTDKKFAKSVKKVGPLWYYASKNIKGYGPGFEEFVRWYKQLRKTGNLGASGKSLNKLKPGMNIAGTEWNPGDHLDPPQIVLILHTLR